MSTLTQVLWLVQGKHCVSSYSGVVVSNDSKLVWYKVNTVSALTQVLWLVTTVNLYGTR